MVEVVLAGVGLMEHQVEQVAAMDQVLLVARVDPASTGIQGKVVHNQLAVRAALILIEGMDQAQQDQLRKGGMAVMILQDLEQVEQAAMHSCLEVLELNQDSPPLESISVLWEVAAVRQTGWE